MFHRRISAHRAFIKHPMDDRLRQQYRAIRRQGTLLNRKLKSVYYKDKFSAATGNPRLQWAVLNQLTGRRKSHPTPKASLSSLSDTLGNIVHDEHRTALTTPDTPADDCLDNCPGASHRLWRWGGHGRGGGGAGSSPGKKFKN